MSESSSLNYAVGYAAQQEHPAFKAHDPHEFILRGRFAALKVDDVA